MAHNINLSQRARAIGISVSTAASRVRNGRTIEDALTTPLQRPKRSRGARPTSKPHRTASGYVGVTPTGDYRYRAYVRVNGKRLYSACYADPRSAAIARDLYILDHDLQRQLNFRADSRDIREAHANPPVQAKGSRGGWEAQRTQHSDVPVPADKQVAIRYDADGRLQAVQQ